MAKQKVRSPTKRKKALHDYKRLIYRLVDYAVMGKDVKIVATLKYVKHENTAYTNLIRVMEPNGTEIFWNTEPTHTGFVKLVPAGEAMKLAEEHYIREGFSVETLRTIWPQGETQ